MTKNIKTCTISFLVVLLLTVCFSIVAVPPALAAENVKLVGDSSGLVLVPEGGKLFDLGRLNPGDKISCTLEICNNYSEPFALYMRAERIGEKSDPDLLEQLKLTIRYRGEIIYQGPASGKGGDIGDMTSNISLGTFDPWECRDLIATIELPGPETGNEFQGVTSEVKWIFTAQSSEIVVEPIEEEIPPPTEEEIPVVVPSTEEKVPIAPPIEEKIPIISKVFPRTGGSSYPYYVIGALALLAGIGFTIKKKS